MIALRCLLFSFVCLAHARSYYNGRSNDGNGASSPSKLRQDEDDFCAGKADGNYADPDNCYGFITCSNQITYKMDCPDDLKYNEEKDQCDWPDNVDCGQASSSPSKLRQDEDDFCAGKADGNYADPDNCYGFISCSNQITYKMDCPDDLKYNEEKDQCDWPDNVDCGQASSLSQLRQGKAVTSVYKLLSAQLKKIRKL